MTSTTRTSTFTTTRRRARNPLYNAVIGLTALAVLLRDCGRSFLRDDGHAPGAESWVDMHARGGDIAILLAAVATVVAFWNCGVAATCGPGAQR